MLFSFASHKIAGVPCWSAILGGFLSVFLTGAGRAHPYPDVPVWSFFDSSQTARIEIEIDVRCFAEDPDKEPYLQYWILSEMAEEEKSALLKKAAEFVGKTVAFRFEPAGSPDPAFDFRFEKLGKGKLEKAGDPVVIAGEWEIPVPENATGYRIEALSGGRFNVLFLNHINDAAVPRIQVLFPKEKSYLLDLAGPPRRPSPQG